MSKVLVAYATRTKNTQEIAELIAEGIRFTGHEAEVKSCTTIKKKEDLEGYDGYVFGSATYHGQMMESMKTMLFLAEQANLAGKPGGAFGAFGWSGEAPDRIFETMKNIFEMDMVGDPLRLKKASIGGGTQAAQGYGRSVAEKLPG